MLICTGLQINCGPMCALQYFWLFALTFLHHKLQTWFIHTGLKTDVLHDYYKLLEVPRSFQSCANRSAFSVTSVQSKWKNVFLCFNYLIVFLLVLPDFGSIVLLWLQLQLLFVFIEQTETFKVQCIPHLSMNQAHEQSLTQSATVTVACWYSDFKYFSFFFTILSLPCSFLPPFFMICSFSVLIHLSVLSVCVYI